MRPSWPRRWVRLVADARLARSLRALAAAQAMEALRRGEWDVQALQDYLA